MDLKRAEELLKEFDYQKNGRQLTIRFLITILNELYGLEKGKN